MYKKKISYLGIFHLYDDRQHDYGGKLGRAKAKYTPSAGC